MSLITFEDYAESRGFRIINSFAPTEGPEVVREITTLCRIEDGLMTGMDIPNDHPDLGVWEAIIDMAEASDRRIRSARV